MKYGNRKIKQPKMVVENLAADYHDNGGNGESGQNSSEDLNLSPASQRVNLQGSPISIHKNRKFKIDSTMHNQVRPWDQQ